MATINFTQGKFESFLDSGAPNNGGDVGFFVADGAYSTPLTTYTTSALSVANAHPLVLDSAGRGTVFFSGNADVRIRDSAAATVYTQRNVNPSVLIASYLYTTAQTLSGVHAESMVEVTGTTTISLTASSTLAEGWRCWIKNTGSGVVTIDRLAGGDKINGTAADITLPAGASLMIAVADAVDGFTTYGVNFGEDNTWTGDNDHTGIESFALTKFSTALGANYLNNAAFSAAVGTNILTVTLLGEDLAAPSATNPVQIAFRSATLTTGGSTVRTATAATTVAAPDGATLGFIASEASYVYVYAIDNAGTIELALSGSPQDTSGRVTSTTIGTGSDTKATLYSTTGRTDVACRYLGKILITTGATPGQWDSSPTSVHGVNETPPMWAIGYNQTWQDMSGSRAGATEYTNSTGRPIQVKLITTGFGAIGVSYTVQFWVGATSASLKIDEAQMASNGSTSVGGIMTVGGIVPPGHVYKVEYTNTAEGAWLELR